MDMQPPTLHSGSQQAPASAAYRNEIRNALASRTFLFTLEHVPDLLQSGEGPLQELRRNAELVGQDDRVLGVNIGDRVKSMHSHSTVECGRIAAEASGKIPLLHLAGKGREPAQARGVIEDALSLGLRNFLLVTGDRVTEESTTGRTRYQESIVAIRDAKRMAPDCVVAAAVSPFKYREEELLNQYLKMAKKIAVGADYLITNCGWDMRKFEELIWYRSARGFDIPIVANLLLPSLGWARGIHSGRLAGVHMSDDLFAKILEENALGKQPARQRYFNRLALQVVGVKLMGYAGVQLSGVDTYEDLCHVIELTGGLETSLTTLDEWRLAWDEAHRLDDGRIASFGKPGGLYLFDEGKQPSPHSLAAPPRLTEGVQPSTEEMKKFDRMARIHRNFFDDGAAGTAVFSPLVKTVSKVAVGRKVVLNVEHAIKQPTLGCESCGFCRIEHLMYICPETCPKGLANGACSGTDDNVCEFKDRECVHNRKYRIAKALNRLEELEDTYIPAVEGTRDTSSWVNFFEGTIPEVTRLPEKK